MRIALIGTPRSGNTWFRSLLADALDLEQIAVHNYLDLTEPLPSRLVLQLHWYREPNFQAFLRRHDFIPVTIARHPLDVLVSVMHFIRYEPDTAKWLGGNVAIPPGLRDAAPASPAFLDWALGWGAENLLSVSYQWWHEPGAHRVRYEELVADPWLAFSRLAAALDPKLVDAAEAAADRSRFTTLAGLPNRHGWQGRTGLWRELVPPLDAMRIYLRHRRVFRVLGYDCRPAPITRAGARRTWEALKR